MLILFAPGAPREGYEERAAFMTFHHTYWV